MLRSALPVTLVAVLVPACADTSSTEDSADDSFLVAGKADSLGIDPAGPEACAILKLATLGAEDFLDRTVRLNAKAVDGIIAMREGADPDDPDDDLRFASLQRLDAAKYVGPAAFGRMLAFVKSEKGQEFACKDVPVQLLSFNDFHGAMENPSGSGGRITTAAGPVDAGGVEYLATHIKTLRETNPNTLVVTAGDNIGATPLLSAAFHDEPTIESLDALGLDISSVGNHEFDEGIEELWRIQFGGVHPDAEDQDGGFDKDGYDGAKFTYLAANVIYDEDALPVFMPYTVRNFGLAKIAFIGMTLEGTPNVVTAAGVAGLTFLDEVETANALVPKLKELGAETIVVLIHEGGASSGPYNKCEGISGPIFDIVNKLDPEIDVVISGHTNGAYACDINGRVVTSAAHNGRLVSDIDLIIDEYTGEVKSMKTDNVIVTRDVAKDADQTAIIAKWKALIGPIANRVVATIAGDITKTVNALGESALGDLIADAQLAAASGAQIAFMNPGGIRTDLVASQVSGGEQVGEVTYGELFSVQPFANNLIVMDMTGAQIERVLEEPFFDFAKNAERTFTAPAVPPVLQISNGFTYVLDMSKPAGDRVDPSTIKLNGVTLDPNATYRVVGNVFLMGGGDGFAGFKQGINRTSGIFDLEALEAYLKDRPGFAAPTLGRILAP